MRFISYAQNFEDVMLWRALRHVPGGCYIDVGANDPLKDSVTKAFYDRGWHGINVEPVAAHHSDLERDRPRDINLRCALGAADGSVDLWESEVPGWSTIDAAVVEQHIQAGHRGVYHRVPVTTLAGVCAEHAPAEIHFLKIDVEGGEESVLAGADFRRYRPWIVVVEATRPNSTEQKHQLWEHLLTGVDYRLAYADGLNRFYVAQEHQELAEALVYPPNIFDAFIVAQQFNAEQQAQQLQEVVAQEHQRIVQLDASLRDCAERAQEHEAAARAAEERGAQLLHSAQLVAQQMQQRQAELQLQLTDARLTVAHVYASRSWRVTRPIRWVGSWLRTLRSGESARPPAAGAAADRTGPAVADSQRGGNSLEPAQPLADKLVQPDAIQPLPPRARRVFREIKRAHETKESS